MYNTIVQLYKYMHTVLFSFSEELCASLQSTLGILGFLSKIKSSVIDLAFNLLIN